MSAHVLLNLLNELGKRDKMRGLHKYRKIHTLSFTKYLRTPTGGIHKYRRVSTFGVHLHTKVS